MLAAHRTKKGRIAFRVRIPKIRHRHGYHGKVPRYVSPATQSITIGINGPSTVSVTASLTPSSSGCKSSLANVVCQFSYALAPGSYTATLTTYDTPNGTGNVLSTAQGIAFTVTAGQTNTVALTLSGVPKSLLVTPLGALTASNPGQGIDLFGTVAQKFMVQALDADGYTIFGPGSPSFSVSQSSGSLALTLGQPSTGAPNVFTIAPPSTFSTNTATVTVTASYAGQATNGCAQAGAVCSTSFTVDMKELIAADNGGSVSVYRDGQVTPFVTITNGVNSRPASGQDAIAFDSSGNLYVGNCYAGCGIGTSSDTIAIYAPPYTGAPVSISAGIFEPQAIVVDSSGNLWVSNCNSCNGGADTIVKYTPPFSNASTPALTMSANLDDPVAMAFDALGNLWVANCASCGAGGTSTVTAYAPPYTGIPLYTLTGLQGPQALAFDSSRDVYVADPPAATVLLFSAAGGYASSGPNGPQKIGSVGGTSFSDPVALYVDGSNDVWIADNLAGEVFKCGPPSNGVCSSSLGITSGIASPSDLAFDGVANLYVANLRGSLTEYAAPYSTLTSQSTNSSGPFGLAVLP